MNKTELVDAVTARNHQTKALTASVVDAILETVPKSLSRDQPVLRMGFGVFEVFERSAKKTRLPGKWQPMTILAKKVVKSKPGKLLSDSADGSRNARGRR